MKKNLTKVGGNILAGVVFVVILAVAAAIITACVCGIVSLWRLVNLRPAENFQSAETSEGAAWIMPESGEAAVWLSPVCEDEAETARVLEEYTEGDVPVPAWWNPDEPMSSEWFAEEASGVGLRPTSDARKDIGCTDLCVESAERIYDVPLDPSLLDYIRQLCEESGLPITLVLAVIEAESGYRADVISRTSDYGLMQINAVCHGWLAETLGVTDFLDPYDNIRAGVYILSDYYNRYGYVSGTLVCYNMGEAGAKALFEAGVYETDYSRRVMGIMERLEGERNG